MKTIEQLFIVGLAMAAGYYMHFSFGYEVAVCILLGAILGNLQYLNINKKDND